MQCLKMTSLLFNEIKKAKKSSSCTLKRHIPQPTLVSFNILKIRVKKKETKTKTPSTLKTVENEFTSKDVYSRVLSCL